MPSRIHIFPSGRRIALVKRQQLRVSAAVRRSLDVKTLIGPPPPPKNPSSWDNSNGEKLDYQCYCNGPPWPNPVGDCYYEAIIHGSSNFTGNSTPGQEFEAVAEQVYNRYTTLSGGDNGLDDQQAMPEWLGGVVGPNGPRKILDYMVVTAAPGSADWQEFMWLSGGLIWTCSLLQAWLNIDSPGGVWDAGSPADPDAGHAMFLTGRKSLTGPTDTRTWGITPPIQVTDAGFAAAQSEFIAVFSVDQFNPTTGLCAFSGMSWEDKRQWWISVGGKDVGASPFGPPVPPTPIPPNPTPPTPVPPNPTPGPTPSNGVSAILTYTDGVLTGVNQSGTSGLSINWQAIFQAVVADLQAGKTFSQIFADIAALLTGSNVTTEVGTYLLTQKSILTPTQWMQLIQVLLQLLPIFFGS